MFTLAIVAKTGSNILESLADLDLGRIEVFDFWKERDKIMEPGEEGYRQVINYFGEDFLYKDGWLNLKKLWKFIYADFHKLRIFEHLMEPLLMNQLQKREKASNRRGLLIILPGLVDSELYQKFNNLFWLDLPKDQLVKNLEIGEWAVAADKLVDVEERLFVKPDKNMALFKNKEELLEQVEKWLKFI